MNLNAEFSRLLGLPRSTTRAVLVLEAGALPMLHIECHALNLTTRKPEVVDGEVAKLRFKVRLEPFDGDWPVLSHD